MGRFKNLKPAVPKRYLLFVAASVWTLAGLILWFRAAAMVIQEHFSLLWSIAIAITWGVLFYLLIFARISLKHTRRIFKIELERPCVFSFFSGRSYILMVVMISSGVFLRLSGAVDTVIIGVFYMIMGVPLVLSSVRFWHYGIMYKSFSEKFMAETGEKIKVLSRW